MGIVMDPTDLHYPGKRRKNVIDVEYLLNLNFPRCYFEYNAFRHLNRMAKDKYTITKPLEHSTQSNNTRTQGKYSELKHEMSNSAVSPGNHHSNGLSLPVDTYAIILLF